MNSTAIWISPPSYPTQCLLEDILMHRSHPHVQHINHLFLLLKPRGHNSLVMTL